MKKIYALYLLLIAVFLPSCSVDSIFDRESDGYTTLTFTPLFCIDSGTRSFSDNPQVRNLYLAVFNEDGKSLVEYVKAEPLEPASSNEPDNYTYTVTLKVSSKPRVIHYIANAPEELSYGSDVDAVANLICSFDTEQWAGEDAYWGYLNLPGGICSQTDPGFGTLQTKMSEVTLVRNFAKIKVQRAEESNFTVTRFWLTNIPDRASLAPYNRNLRRFEKSYSSYLYATDAMDAGYPGFCPVSANYLSISGLEQSRLDEIASPAGSYAYTYECEKPVDKPLYIIVGGTSNLCSTETFYKVDIRDAEGKYIPILRNFIYTVNIGNVKKVGEATVEAALNSIASGSIDTDVSLQSLKDLSNGKSRLGVNETEKIVFDDDPILLKYSYMPDITTGVIVNKTLEQWVDGVTYTSQQQVLDAHEPYVTITSESGISGNVFDHYTVGDTDDVKDGYRPVTLYPNLVSDIIKTQVFTVTGHVWSDAKGQYETLSRTVRYQMREKIKMTLRLSPDKVRAQKAGDTISLVIGIDANLPSSLFTLDLNIESEQRSLTPIGNELSISSAVGQDGKPTFVITKAITRELYDETSSVIDPDGVVRKHFICSLMTNTKNFMYVDSSFGQGDRIFVSNEHFKTAEEVLMAGDDYFYRFVNPRFDRSSLAPEHPAQILFGMSSLPSDGTIFIRMRGIEPVDKDLIKWVSDADNEYSIYKVPVSNKSLEHIDVIPVADKYVAYFQLFDDEFNDSANYDIEINKLDFTNVRLAYGSQNYVAPGRIAKASFHMEDIPLDHNVTIYLKNVTPVDVSLVGTPSIDGYTSYILPVNSLDVSLDVNVTPSAGATNAYFKIIDDEFNPSNEVVSEIRKHNFTSVNFENSGLSYLVQGVAGQTLNIVLEEMPSSGNISLYLKGVTAPDLASLGAGSGEYAGYTLYDLPVSSTSLSVNVAPVSGQTSASVKLAHNEFNNASNSVDILKRYTIDWSKVLIKSNDSGNPAQGNTNVSVYTTSDCTGTAFKSFTTTTDPAGYGPGTAGLTNVDCENGANVFYYFKFNRGVDYISDGFSLKYLAENDPAEVICKIQAWGHVFEAGELYATINGEKPANSAVLHWSTPSGYSGDIQLGSGSTKGKNTGKATITCTSTESITFSIGSNTGSYTISQLESGTTINLK